MLADWETDNVDDDDSDEDDEEAEEQRTPVGHSTKKDLNLKDNVLDHIVLAALDLEEARTAFENMTGIRPAIVGPHRGLGIKSARVGLDNNTYIEIIAPDPNSEGPIGAALLTELQEGALVPYHYAVRASGIAKMRDDYLLMKERTMQPDHITMVEAGPDETIRKWDMLFIYGHRLGGCIPIYVDWLECDHPSAFIPEVGELKNFVVRAPAGDKLQELLKTIDGITLQSGDALLEFSFSSPKGTIKFSADHPKGYMFPGYEEAIRRGFDGTEYKFPGKICRESIDLISYFSITF